MFGNEHENSPPLTSVSHFKFEIDLQTVSRDITQSLLTQDSLSYKNSEINKINWLPVGHFGFYIGKICHVLSDMLFHIRAYRFSYHAVSPRKLVKLTKNGRQSAILDFISAKFVTGYYCVIPYILFYIHGSAISLCFTVT